MSDKSSDHRAKLPAIVVSAIRTSLERGDSPGETLLALRVISPKLMRWNRKAIEAEIAAVANELRSRKN